MRLVSPETSSEMREAEVLKVIKEKLNFPIVKEIQHYLMSNVN